MTITEFDYLATRDELIADAFEIVGAKEGHQTLSAYQLAQGIRALQLLVKHWENKHLFLWSFNQTSFSTVAAQEVYTTADLTGDDDAIIGLDKAWVVDSSEDIPIEVISPSRYEDIPDKTTNTGRPTAIAFKPTPSPSFIVWPSPDAAYTIKLLSVYPLKDFDTASGAGNLPVQFQQALLYGLADKLFDKYPGPMNERLLIQGKAEQFFKEARISDTPKNTTNEVEGLFKSR